jgi:hypothetical protein
MLDLTKNNLGDKGVWHLMSVIRHNRSIVCLNLASNEISGVGFGYIFDAMCTNESIITLNLSTHDNYNRNRLTKKSAVKLKQMLIENDYLEILNISAINLGDVGMQEIVHAFNHGIQQTLKEEKKKE